MEAMERAGGCFGAKAAARNSTRDIRQKERTLSYREILHAMMEKEEDGEKAAPASVWQGPRGCGVFAPSERALRKKQEEDRELVLRAEKKKRKRKLLKLLDELYHEKQRVIRENDARIAFVRSANAKNAKPVTPDLKDIPVQSPSTPLWAIIKSGGAGR